MSTILCQLTAQFVSNDPTPYLIRALKPALAHFLDRYVCHTPNLGWELAQVALCVSSTNQASVNAWLALSPEQRQHHLTQAVHAYTHLVCHAPELRLMLAAPANPERSISVYLPKNQGGCAFCFEFPGDFYFLPGAKNGGSCHDANDRRAG